MTDSGKYREIICRMAARCYASLSPWGRIKYGLQDLIQEGYVVLLDTAVQTYEQERGVPFGGWLHICLLSRYNNILTAENRHIEVRADWMYGSSEPEDSLIPRRTSKYEEIYKSYDAASRRTPEDEAAFRQAVDGLYELSPEFIEFVLGDCPRACKWRRKLVVHQKRKNHRKNLRPGFKKRHRVAPSTGAVLEFLGIDRTFFSELRELFYKVITGR